VAIQLSVDRRWKQDQLRVRRWYWAYPILLATAVALSVVGVLFATPFLFLMIGLAIVFGAVVYGFDPPFTRTHRFDRAASPVVTATTQGLEADAYPLAWYVPARTSQVGGYEISQTALVVRSRLFGRPAEVVDRPNFVPWAKTSIVLDLVDGEPTVRFWSRNVLEDNSILAGLTCQLAPGEVRRFFETAIEGGSDIHVATRWLTDTGRAAVVPCPRHDDSRSRIPDRPPRLRRPLNASEAGTWLRDSPV
jgi:hypothetical protein